MEPGELNRAFKATLSRYVELWSELVRDGELPDDQSQDPGDLARAEVARAGSSANLREFVELGESPLIDTDGPLWYRGASMCRKLFARPVLDASLTNIQASDVVVGHTTTPDRRVHELHDSKFTLLDTGMLVSYYQGRPAALIIEGDQRIVQYLDPNEQLAAAVDDFPQAYGFSHDELADVLKNADILSVDDSAEPIRVRLLHDLTQFLAEFYPRGRKKEGERELAAYTLSQMLGFDIVPITIERSVQGELGALQLVFPDAISESEPAAKKLGFKGWCSMTDQFDLLHVWDALVDNTSRTTDNVIYRRGSWRLEAIDYAKAFSNDKRLSRAISSGLVKLVLRPEVRNALGTLDEATLLAEFDGILDRKSVLALISRRDALLQLAE
jgi:hypothetical protein